MKSLILFVGWCILLVLCWPVALLAFLLFPIVWLVALPFRLLGITFEALLALVSAVLLLPARLFGWIWMDPVMGIVGAGVIANWAYRLVRDTGHVLLDMAPDTGLTKSIRTALETDGDTVSDLHIWRVGPGHLGAVISVATSRQQSPADYKARLASIADLSHVTIEVQNRLAPARVTNAR